MSEPVAVDAPLVAAALALDRGDALSALQWLGLRFDAPALAMNPYAISAGPTVSRSATSAWLDKTLPAGKTSCEMGMSPPHDHGRNRARSLETLSRRWSRGS